MIPNPQAKRILCYGDSNTWGQNPVIKGGRFAADQRWTGLLQLSLGTEYAVIEEGLSSRTTDLEYGQKPGRNGKTYFRPCLESQSPLDMVIIMLGTNDFKLQFGPRPIADIAAALCGYIEDARTYAKSAQGTPAKVVLMSPIHVNAAAPHFAEWYSAHYNEGSVVLSKTLGAKLQKVANDMDCFFFEAASVAGPGDDGIHMNAQGHSALGNELANNVIKWFK